ncbi:hypothetical protein R3P38DRAFT_3173004 [Favolaschia claudopus]|uniref:Uncharacterized protein n=1 Tax=Favolaschia claudopus TaxID=2862362 RepID=A0AAW0DQU9_9AGAR
MPNARHCRIPLHFEDGVTFDTAQVIYLITCPEAGALRGAYSSWVSAEQASRQYKGPWAARMYTWSQAVSTWNRCCEAGEHDHPAFSDSPPSSRPSTPSSSPPSSRPSTPPPNPRLRGKATTLASPLPPSFSSSAQAAASKPKIKGPRLAPRVSSPKGRFVVQGSGEVRDSYREATEDFARMGTLLTPADDLLVASHIARGSSIPEARALVAVRQALQSLEAVSPSEDEEEAEALIPALENALRALHLRRCVPGGSGGSSGGKGKAREIDVFEQPEGFGWDSDTSQWVSK